MFKSGSKKSKKPEIPEKRITLETWKKMPVKIPSKPELLKEIKELAPQTSKKLPEFPYYNILLTGQIGSGKSSVFNSINSIFTERVFNKEIAGEKAQSLTQEFHMHQIKPDPLSKPLPFRIYDTQGLEVHKRLEDEDDYDEHDVRNILSCVDGHVPDRYVFTEGDFFVDCPGYIKDPPLMDKVHCVCVTIDASSIKNIQKPFWQKIKSMMAGLVSRNIPILILLTKIDLLGCDTFGGHIKSVKNVFRSKVLREECVQPLQEKLKRYVAKEQILPIKNYVRGVEFDDDTDVLLLLALSQMLKSAKDFLDSKRNDYERNSDRFSMTQDGIKMANKEQAVLAQLKYQFNTNLLTES